MLKKPAAKQSDKEGENKYIFNMIQIKNPQSKSILFK